MTYKVKRAIRKRNRAWRKYSENRTYFQFLQYKKARNKVVSVIRKARINFEKKLAAQVKNDPKSFFAYVRSKTKAKDKVGPLVNNGGEVVKEEVEMCEVLNDFFVCIYSRR